MQELASRTKTRLYIMAVIVFGFSAFLYLRLFILQVVQGQEYTRKAMENRNQVIRVPAFRSVIVDRNETNRLAYNRKSLSLLVIPGNLPEDPLRREIILSNAAELLEMSYAEVTNTIKEQSMDKYTPVLLKFDVDTRTMVRFFEHFDLYRDGFYLENRPRRIYPLREKAAQLIGYTGVISKDELKGLKTNSEYHAGSLIGKMGIEKFYDSLVRGKEGIVYRVMDARGNMIDEEVIREADPGDTVVLSIDSDVQALAYDLMKDKNGAVVVSRPATGEILALISRPSFDPNIFTDRFSIEEFFDLKNNQDKPFLNRAIQGIYPPSSIFKLVTTAAILNAGQDPNRIIFCPGEQRIGNRIFKCWERHNHQNLRGALVNSCDVYYYTLGMQIGREKILSYAESFGVNKKTGIDIPGEYTGLIPEMEWFKKMYRRPWQNGDTANISIGQGDLLSTPVGINVMTMAIVNDGIIYRPYILKKVMNFNDQKTIWEQKPEVMRKVDLAPEHFDFLRKGMYGVATEGTAKWLKYLTWVPFAAKTGTGEAGEGREDHAWFTCYAPYNFTNINDVIAVTVIVEHGGWGSAVAAPVAAQIIDFYYKNKVIMTFPAPKE